MIYEKTTLCVVFTLIQTNDTCRTAEVTEEWLEKFEEEAAAVQEVTCNNVRLRNSDLQYNDMTRIETKDQWCFHCDQCGTKHEHHKCPVYGATCWKCNGHTHFAKMRRSK
ncbi:hypothetical protein PR048_005110 [Dryococelus australis]|uniref:Uncharacterized protein n=1 Tax=Dryococelus australis TaxID=614101 RepID=A0ABQ9I7A1_9NEOP|nr:hypothetical protein PR048_005110 [Dryococelus australis]